MAIVRTRDPNLSLWQSAVARVVLETSAKDGLPLSQNALLDHPMVRATNDLVRAHETRQQLTFSADQLQDEHARNTHLSSLCFEIAQARAEGLEDLESQLLGSYWPFSDKDPNFLRCVAVFVHYEAAFSGQFRYNDWQKEGGGSLQYGVIDWRIPNDARVGIIGDWGTGMDDSVALLRDIMVNHQPTAIIHLGDIYYSGTPHECDDRFNAPITRVFDEVLGKGNRIPVFTLPGNHDYYALGYGFLPMLSSLNLGLPAARQDASYFCLRTEDDGWQFLGMDTGWADADPANQKNPLYAGPWVQPSEVVWHRDKLANFGGATVLLSHHQLFSANAKINGMASSQSEFPYLNAFLMSAFQPFFRDRIAAWAWGHEHNLVLYRDGLFGLSKGRLEGASAFEEMGSESPYDNKYPDKVPYLDPEKYRLQPNAEGYYSHSYSVIDLSVRKRPTDPIRATYYDFPSWYRQAPDSPASTQVFVEDYVLPQPKPQAEVTFGSKVQLSVEGGLAHLSTLKSMGEYFPTVGSAPVTLQLQSIDGTAGAIQSGAKVAIRTTEAAAGDYNLLGAFGTRTIYYYVRKRYLRDYGPNETWTVIKADRRVDGTIRFGDAVWFVNQAYAGQTIAPTNDGYLTTTHDRPETLFVIQQA